MPHIPEKHVHLISFDIPYPPDYGGAIEVFYKLKALKDIGVKVHLHCFEYGRDKSSELESACYKVHYYRREHGLQYLFSRKPYIVATRNNRNLFNNLLRDEHPIIYEGLHTTIFAGRESLKNRLQIVRMHNVEHRYYSNLARSSRSFRNRIFFRMESIKLRLYEKSLDNVLGIATISEDDTNYFRNHYKDKFRLIKHIPPFHENDRIISQPGRGNYVLYHGNLSVSENEKAVLFIVNRIFSRIEIPLVVAGKNPTRKIGEAAKKAGHVKLIANPGASEMDDLLKNAHIHLLPACHVSGMRLKLINSLYKGRFCIANDLMIRNTGLEDLCLKAGHPQEYIDIITDIFGKEFTAEELKKREAVLPVKYSNSRSASQLMEMTVL